MIGTDSLDLSTNDLLVVVSVALILIAFAIWRIFYVNSDGPQDTELTDGAVILLSDGMVRQASPAAVALLGDCLNTPVVRLLDELLGPEAATARDAVNRLEMTGEPVDMLVHTAAGEPYELIGAPAGAMIRLILRDAALLDGQLRDAQARVNAADDALQTHEWAQETMRGLIDEAPIIAWHRTAEGAVNWSGGEIRARNGSVSADQAVDLIVARTKLNRQPVLAGQPQKSRIEIVVNDGAETVSLHVIEIVRQDGSRIGLATDAGTAASAERTLTRFVQTMTETFAHLTVGLAIFDRNQTLALFNPALVQMWQVEPAWLARRPSLRDIIDELRATRRLPELQDFHKWRTRLVNLFENTEAADYEELWHLADGSNIRVLARPHPHGSLAFIFDDVTERMRLEQRYRHSIDLRRATLDGLDEGVAVFGSNGLLQFVNQSFHDIWGTDAETVYAAMHARQLVSFCEELTHEEETWHRLHSFITGEESRRAWSARLTMRSGRLLTARFAPLPDGSTMAVFADITESERVAVTLRRRNEALSFAEIAHKAIRDRVDSQVLPTLAKLGADNGQADDADTIRAQIENVLHDVLELSSPQLQRAGSDDLKCVPKKVIAICQRLLSHQAVISGITVEIGETTDTPIPMDRYVVSQILYTLAYGALQHCREQVTLTLGNKIDENSCTLSMRAHGPVETVLKDARDDGSALISPAVHALAARMNALVALEDSDRADIRIECRFEPSEQPSAPPPLDDEFTKDGNWPDDGGNVHGLPTKIAG